MGVRLEKPWRPLTAEAVADLDAELGVFQLANAAGEVVRIGYAGARTLFGLRSELQVALAAREAAQFRTEVTSQYLSRWEELLMVHIHDHGRLPDGNQSEARRRIGRLSPG